MRTTLLARSFGCARSSACAPISGLLIGVGVVIKVGRRACGSILFDLDDGRFTRNLERGTANAAAAAATELEASPANRSIDSHTQVADPTSPTGDTFRALSLLARSRASLWEIFSFYLAENVL